jgi:adenylate cyclase
MSFTQQDQAIMFADIVGSTSLYKTLGDTAARSAVAECLDVAKRSITDHSGSIVTELGDEVMASFDDTGDAGAAACEIHANMAETYDGDTAAGRSRMRVGLHYGPVVGEDNNVASETAKIAHWVASNAKAEQTLGTSAVINALPRIYPAVSRYVDDETWNFISIEHLEVHEHFRDVEGVTAYFGEIPTLQSRRSSEFQFSYRGVSATLNSERPVISIGRGTANDMNVRSNLASRQHLSVQFSRGRCTIIDNSTNGTVIYLEPDGDEIKLKRDSYTLVGAGRIVLGQPEEVGDDDLISYSSK